MKKSHDILTGSEQEGDQFGKLTCAELATGSCQTVFKMSQAPKVSGNWLKAIRLYLSKKKKETIIRVFKI